MNALVPVITFGNLVKGFPEWYKTTHAEIDTAFTNLSTDVRSQLDDKIWGQLSEETRAELSQKGVSEYDTVEDFALELFYEVSHA